MKFNELLVLLIVTVIGSAFGDRTKDKMYDSVSGSMCFRRLNATHQTGCSSSSKSGNVGVLFLVQNESDLEFITSHPPSPPYAAIVTPKLFTRENILKLRDSEFISAIVLINDTRGMQSFSEESRCPNSFFTHVLQPKCDVNKPEKTWNPYGTGLLQENFDIPIIFLSSKNESEKVLKCFNDFNKDPETHKDGSLCSIEVNSFMSAAGNSEICMRRSNGLKLINQIHYCDPMQGKNVYATLFPRPIVDPDNRTNDKNEKIILISSHLDTTSMFDGLGDGATELASLTTLITAGHYLRKIIPNEVYERNNINVMFVIFNGESYDFIGSQRLVYDLKKGDAFPLRSSYSNPLKLENIMMMIDIGSLDSLTDLNFYHLKDTDMSKKFIDSVNYYKNKFNFSTQITTNVTNNIPPVSAQSFLRENITFPAFVLATAEPENKFYHSIYDDKANLNFTYHNTSKDFDVLPSALDNLGFDEKSVQIKIRNVASLLALAVYDMLSNDFKYKDNLVASPVLVDEFLFCYLDATKCSLFKAIFELTGNFQGSDYPPPRYISVQPAIILEATFWAHRTFGYVLSEKVADVKKENCTFLPLYWIPGSQLSGECRRMTQNYSFALSPAFLEDGYNFKSNQYSTWTESTWNELSARIFLKPSATHQSLTFSIGFVVMIISFVIVYLVNSKTDVLFAEVAVEHVALPAQC